MWACANCRETIEDDFDACWRCGCSREGKLNLEFAKETADAGESSSVEQAFAEEFKCQKCQHRDARVERITGSGTGLARVVAKEFLAVSCENCGYTELFNLTVLEGRTKLQNFLRGLFRPLRYPATTNPVRRSENLMTISSRTPEGFPSRCSVCGAEVNLEFSDPPGDAPCPNCNHLLWLCCDLLSTFKRQYHQSKGIPPERITADTEFADLGADSLESVELVMAMEEDFGIHLPSAVADRIETIGDAIRYIEEQRRGEGG